MVKRVFKTRKPRFLNLDLKELAVTFDEPRFSRKRFGVEHDHDPRIPFTRPE